MLNETQVTLTQGELTQILILCSEFVRRNAVLRQTDLKAPSAHLDIWLRNCNSIIAKTDKALALCMVIGADDLR